MYRTMHFVPAHKANLKAKLQGIPADAFILDLEDGVPETEKKSARANLAAFREATSAAFWVRVNSRSSVDHDADLDAVSHLGVDGVIVPKVEGSSDLEQVRQAAPHASLIPLIESFRGLLAIGDTLLFEGVAGLGLGLEDMFSELPTVTDPDPALVAHVKAQIVVAARSHRVGCWDTIFGNFEDPVGLVKSTHESKRMGFDGRFTIHPAQVAAVNAVFFPTPEDVSWASRIMALAGGDLLTGYKMVDGEMLTPPKVRRARAILDRKARNGSGIQ